MHELGIVFHIAKQVEEVAKENDVKHINEVILQVGEVSTVIPAYLTDCWDWNCKKSEVLNGCKLTCEQIKAVTFCEGCNKEYPTVEFGKICPHCGSENTYLVTGNEVMLKEVVADD
ncbi:MAG: hydrogenase maturation nickel metallochaperone HypA [Pseudobutyrivibrio sp.]|nr:hydrogenase maturation nickel metallochaperone HypA [Pseudobutyrivibrio sp.]